MIEIIKIDVPAVNALLLSDACVFCSRKKENVLKSAATSKLLTILIDITHKP
ncbi:MAG: hypothetical protein IJW12_06665 [Opitutales bacterium]|nr:hypothetical protein [Opitutales bacterium]